MRSRGKALRLAIVCCAVAALAMPTGHGLAGPLRVHRGTFEAAEATWLVKRNGSIYMYFVLAYRLEKPLTTPKVRMFADRSKCRVHRVRGRRVASCSLEGRVDKLAADDFVVGPLASGARLRYRGHVVRWEGTDAPEPDVEPFVDEEAAFADAYLQRLAGARGRLFGRRMPVKMLDHAALSYGVYTGAETSPDEIPPFRRTVVLGANR